MSDVVMRLRCQMSVGFVWSCCDGCRGSCQGWALLIVGVLLSGCLILVLAPGFLSGVVRISRSDGRGHSGQWGCWSLLVWVWSGQG